MFTVNRVKISVFCLAGEINLGTVTKIAPVYPGHAHSTSLTSLVVVDEVQTQTTLHHAVTGPSVESCKPAPLKIRIACI